MNKLAVMFGRFQHFHNGHKLIADIALKESESLLIIVGSSQESGTPRNPFNFVLRMDLIDYIYSLLKFPQVYIGYSPDTTNENDISPEWGRYVLKQIELWSEIYGLPRVDAMYYGNDEERSLWFDDKDIEGIKMNAIEKGKIIDINATKLREMIAKDQYSEWSKQVPQEIHHLFSDLRDKLLKIEFYREMANSNV